MLSSNIVERAKSSDDYMRALKDVIELLEESDVQYNGVHYVVTEYDMQNKIAHNNEPEDDYWRGRRAALMDSYNGLRHITDPKDLR